MRKMISTKDNERYEKACIILASGMKLDQKTKDSLILIKAFGLSLKEGNIFRKASTKSTLTTIVDISKALSDNDLEMIPINPKEIKHE